MILENHHSNSIIRINEISDDCNKLVIQEGRFPENKNEMLMEYGVQESHGVNIGDTLEIEGKKIKIVGSALSPDFLVKSKMIDSRGTSNLGSGKINFCLFAPKDYFDFDYYTTAYIIDNNIKNFNYNSTEYSEAIRKDKDLLNSAKEKLETEKYQKIINEANSKIDDEEAQANSDFKKAKDELDHAKSELDNAKEQLDSSKITLDSSKREISYAESTIYEYEEQLNNAKSELDAGNEKLESAKATLDDSKAELDSGNQQISEYEEKLTNSQNELDIKKQEIEDTLSTQNMTYDQILNFINESIDKYGSKESAIAELKKLAVLYHINESTVEQLIDAAEGILKIEEGYTEIEEAKKELDLQRESLKTAQTTYDEKFAEYEEGLGQYNSKYEEYEANKNKFDIKKDQFDSAKSAYASGLSQYEEGIKTYNSGLEEYNNKLSEYNNKKTEAEQKIKDARKELENIEKTAFYITDKNADYEYSTYMSLSKSFDNLSKTFPLIFIFVTIFISLLSMARMAIENRTEIGTLKALGFTNKEIRVKFILYSMLATLLGGIIGAVIGNYNLSYLCYAILSDIYQVPVYVTTLNIWPIILGNLSAIVAIVGATLIVINQLLKQDATTLLRPMAPPIGKKILLEKIKPLWNHISFHNRIMSRNVFRYKRRVIMSLLGFIGCTSLLMSGYAIKDSMLNIIDMQFNEISYYDQVVNLDGDLSEVKLNELFNYDKIENLVYVKTTLVEFQDSRATFIIPNDINNFKTLFNLKDYKTGEVLEFKNNEVIITASLADNLHKKVGDEIEFVDNNVVQKFKISAIAENYVNSYIYMDKQTYTSSVGKYFINCAFIKFDNLENTDEIVTKLNENEHVLTTTSVKYLKENFKTMLKAFDSIIVVLIVFSALLSFVVMYSLAYITLSERQREIATLKVLGYSGKEIDDYILKEQLNIVILGIIFGIITGSLYSTILVSNIRFSQLYLVKQIEPISYVKTAGFIFIFAVIVGITVHFMLKKLKMIESLKSIE